MRTALCFASLTDLVTDLYALARYTPLVTHPRYTPSLLIIDEQTGPVTARWSCGGALAYCALLFRGTDLVTRPSHTLLQNQPQPGPATPLFPVAWLALNSDNQAGAAEARFAYCAVSDLVITCVAGSLHTPRYTPSLQTLVTHLRRTNRASDWSLELRRRFGVLRFALPRHRPRYTAVTYLVTEPTPARACDPPFFPSLGLR